MKSDLIRKLTLGAELSEREQVLVWMWGVVWLERSDESVVAACEVLGAMGE